MPIAVPANFFCQFKTGDNIVYNFEILSSLYEIENAEYIDSGLLIKPKVIIIVSIIEAILYDFHLRARNNINEGIDNLKDTVINYIRGKVIDEFEQEIQSAKKHDIFDLPEGFYFLLDELRKSRNRIHIQNKYNFNPKNEKNLYDNKLLDDAEKCCEIIVKKMSRKYNRPGNLGDYVKPLIIPWNEHFVL